MKLLTNPLCEEDKVDMCPWTVDIMELNRKDIMSLNRKNFSGVFSCLPCGKASLLQNTGWVSTNHASR